MRLYRKTKYLIILLVLSLFVFLSAELVLRKINPGSFSFWQPHVLYGKSLIPDTKGWYTNEGNALVRINSKGYHDDNHQIKKPVDSYRIAVIGDSFVEALQVPYEKTFWYLLSSQLAHCTALKQDYSKIEILGFGVSNYGTSTQLLMLQQEVAAYQPDEVILGFFQGNDITDNSKFFNQSPSPFYSIVDDELQLDMSFNQQSSFKFRLFLTRINYYALFLKFRVLESIRTGIKKLNAFRQRPNPNNSGKAPDGLILAPSEKKLESIRSMAWQLTQKLILEMHNETKKIGAKFSLLSIPHSVLLHPDQTYIEQRSVQLNVAHYKQTDKAVTQFANNNSIAIVRLSQSLAKYSKDPNNYLFGFKNNILGFGHFNEFGHQKTAEVLAQHICLNAESSI